MASLSNKLKNQLREHLVKVLYESEKDAVKQLLDAEQVEIQNNADIIQWLSKNLWANNISVRDGKYLRLSPEGRHLFDLLVEKNITSKAVQPLEKEQFVDHSLWLDMNRKCPVPWFLIPNTSIDQRIQTVPIMTAGPSRRRQNGNGFRVEFYDYGAGSMHLTLMNTIGDIKKWVKYLD